MADEPPYRSQVLDPLGLVAGMCDALGMSDSIDQATRHNPAMRDLTAGEAVKALVLHGLGFINHARSLVPRFFQHKPTSRLMAPRVTPAQRNDDALGRALDTLYASGVTARSSLIAVTAAQRLGLCPRYAHLDSPRVHGDGRSNSEDEPAEHVVPLPQGSRRAPRPDRNHVMLELIVEHQAGMPVLMKPLSGNSSAGQECGQVVREHGAPLQTTYGAPSLGAERALSSADHLQTLANTPMQWITRVPATLSAAQATLAHADPQARRPLTEGYRSHNLLSTSGGVEQRWILISSEPRQPQAQRPVDQQRLQQSHQAVKACKTLCRNACACEADARQALATLEPGLPATYLPASTVCPTPRDGTRGRPGQGALPAQGLYHLAGALASSLAARQTRVDQHRCFILATHALDATPLPPQAL